MTFKGWWIAVAAIAVFAAGGAYAGTTAGPAKNVRVVRLGTVDLSSISVRANVALSSEILRTALSSNGMVARMRAVNRRTSSPEAASEALQSSLVQTSPVPIATSLKLVKGSVAGYSGFSGLDAFDSDSSPMNNNFQRIGAEPPDQGLCVGDGKVVEAVNLVFVTYDLNGNRAVSATDLNSLFGVPQTDFLSDPKCYYDQPSNTFFITATDLGDTDPENNIWSSTSSVLIGVMPASGTTVSTYQLDSTDASNGICPCFADQPLLGADQYGLYISGNEFKLSPFSVANGAEIFAISKSDLINGVSSPNNRFFPAPIFLAEGTAYSIQPAVAAQGVFDASNNGTEYLVSSLDFTGTFDNRIAVWAITNTCGIASACPYTPQLTYDVISSETYGIPPPARQRRGVFPLGQALRDRFETIETGDDRMQQVVYANGNLYTGLTTVLEVGRRLHSGILYFVIQPSVSGGSVSGSILTSGYAALAGMDLYYPSIAANSTGSAVMAFSMSGARRFPSAAYIPLDANQNLTEIYINHAGMAPEDGASGYLGGALAARWGDYSAAFADDNGNLWIASEYAGSSCTKRRWLRDPTCAGTRGILTNWATAIGEITVP